MANADIRIGLELRRIGGIEGALKLLKLPRNDTCTGEIYVRRVEWSAALLACGISAAESCGVSVFQEFDRATLGVENALGSCRDSSETSYELRERSLRSRALTSVVQVVQGW